MARNFTYEDLMRLRNQGITAPFEGDDSTLATDLQTWKPDELNSDEEEYLQLKNAGLVEQQPSALTQENRQAVEQGSIFKNLTKPPQPNRQQELENLSGKGALIGTEAGLQADQLQQQPQPSRSLTSIVGASPQPKREPSLTEILNFGQNNLASQENLQQAIDERNTRQMLANIGAAANTFSGGLAKTGPVDNSFYDKLGKQAEQSVTDYEKKVDFQKNDPNSAYSKGLREYFKTKLGREIRGDASAVELEKILPLAVREYEAQQERTARAEDRALDRTQRAEDRAADRELRKVLAGASNDKKEELAQGKAKDKLTTNTRLIRKEIMSGPSGKSYNNYLNADRAVKSIQQFMANPTGYSDYGSLMLGLKALQGDDSVVREAEIRMGMNAASLQDKVLNRIQQLRNGKTLRAGQREDILKAVSSLADITKGQFLQAASPQLAQAGELGIPREQLIDTLLEQPSDTTTEKIKAFMKSNPSIKTEEEAMKILKDAGRL